MHLTQEERLLAILEHLKHHGKISIEQICERFGVSRDTARRDLVKLEEERLIVRVRGGAIRPTLTREAIRYEDRVHHEAKRAIGRTAATLIRDGDYVLFDASTTVKCAAEEIYVRDLVAVTNSIDIADALGKSDQATVYLLGGKLNPWHRNIVGTQTVEMLRQYRVDWVFLGACGLTEEGLTSSNPEEAFVKREMIRRADRTVVLADATKFGKTLFHSVCSWEDIDIIVTEQQPDDAFRNILEQHDVQILIATGGENG
ncbi:DeoR/GlpR family DNA-binding transcription regulator [Polycladomyces abyssicola]|uniref:DeoR/GlpR family DNA-binding transcription regulator n=1 Tax=Polycladomyces abyssicola TaxID=1125966 RepID=UPI001FE6747D|nr:DeoR/GlpR family DNA-binding transcription regulator [Polycladomyces abyssicola]